MKRIIHVILFISSILTTVLFSPGTGYPEEQIPPPKTDSCITAKCHADMGKDKFVHGPVGAGKCVVCHGELPKHLKRPSWNHYKKVENVSKICFTCHDQFKPKKFIHKALQEGECIACHSPHGSPNKYQLVEKGGDLCFTCHDKALVSNKYVHGPAAVGGCAVCHEPHTADFKNNLRAEGSALCFMCHTDKEEAFTKAEFTHKPAADNCTGCHNPHSTPVKFMLKSEPPLLCYDCHKDKKDAIENASVKHGAVTTDRKCMNCHDAHTSDIAKNLLLPPMDLCMSCHDKQLETPDGKPLTDMKKLLAQNTDHHGPIKQKDCSGCHDPHGSGNFRILRNPYPASFYKPFNEENYTLCFSCHEQSVVKNPKTTVLTNFRNLDINLHYKHVNKPDKGRTCRACHETHASNFPKHIRDSVPFGKWELPLNFEKTDTGGSCMPGCHQLKKYDRVKFEKNL